MASDFLKKLQESVDSGKPNEAVKAVYNEILDKADQFAGDPKKMKQIEDNIEAAVTKEGEELKKKLTAEEVVELNKVAKLEEERMLEVEQKTMVTSGIITLNCEIEKLELQILIYKSDIEFLKSEAPYKEKKKIIDGVIKQINQ